MSKTKPKSPSLISITESLRSIGFGEPLPILRQNNCVQNSFRILSEQSKPVRDYISIVFYCKTHDRILLGKLKTGEVFFPWYSISCGQSPSEAIKIAMDRTLKIAFPNYFPTPKDYKLARIVRLPVCDAQDSVITVYTYYAYVTHEKYYENVPDPNTIKRCPSLFDTVGSNFWNAEQEISHVWTPYNDINQIRLLFWGPEVLEQSTQARNSHMKLKDLNVEFVEHCLSSIQQFTVDSSGQFMGVRDARAFIHHSRIDQEMFIALWNEWVFHCAPSTGMCLLSFKKFLHKLDIVPKNVSKNVLEEFDRLVRRLYYAFQNTGESLRHEYRQFGSSRSNCADSEIADLRDFTPKSSLPQLDFLSFVLGLAILDSDLTLHVFWDIHMLFTFMYHSYNEENTLTVTGSIIDDDGLTVQQFKNLVDESPKLMMVDLVNKVNINDKSERSSERGCSERINMDNCATVLMKKLGRVESVNEKTTLIMGDFRFWKNTSKSEEMQDILILLARAHFHPDQDGHILRRIQNKMFVRQPIGSASPHPRKFWPEMQNMERSLKISRNSTETNLGVRMGAELAQQISANNLERERCGECTNSSFKLSSVLTNMNKTGNVTEFLNIDGQGVNEQPNICNLNLPNLYIEFNNFRGFQQMAKLHLRILDRKAEVRSLLHHAKEMLQKDYNLIVHVDGPTVVVGEVRGNLPAVVRISENVCPVFSHLCSVNFIACGNYFDENQGLEAFLYLVSAKIFSFDRVVLLRGPNDCRECLGKLQHFQKRIIEDFDKDTWNLLMDCLDLLPIAAVISKKIFVSKSGVPLTGQKLKYIKEFYPKNAKKEEQLVGANQILHGTIVKSKSKSSIDSDKSISVLSAISVAKVPGKKMRASRNSRNIKKESSKIISAKLCHTHLSAPISITLHEIESFLSRNQFTHFVRSDCWTSGDSEAKELAHHKSYRVQSNGKVITLGSLQFIHSKKTPTKDDSLPVFGKINAAVLLVKNSSLQILKLCPELA